jgi:transcriptional regulator with XRE-family HTH domain
MKKLRILALRQAKYMTQDRLAKSAGIQLRTIANIEGGHYKVQPRYSTLQALAKALEVNVDDLFEDETASV